jgi:hypothetical protein
MSVLMSIKDVTRAEGGRAPASGPMPAMALEGG